MGTLPSGLPAAEDVIAVAREALAAGALEDARRALDVFAPVIDELADAGAAAEWLGISTSSIYRERSRTRADGSPAWPAPDRTFAGGRSGAWTFRTLALHRASMPGRGSAGRGRPRRKLSD